MYRRHGQKLSLVFLACDLTVTAGVWFAAYFVRFAVWTSPQGVPDVWLVVQSLPIVLALAAAAYRLGGLYEIHRLQQLPREAGTICKATGLLFLLAIAAAFYRRDVYESRLALAVFLGLNTAALVAARRGVWWMLARLRHRGLNRGQAIIAGAGRCGRIVAHTLLQNAWTGLEPVGFVDRPGPRSPKLLPRLGDLGDLAEVVKAYDVDHVFVALPLSRYSELPAVYQTLGDLLVEVHLVPDIPSLAGMRVRSLEIDDVAFLSLRENPHSGWDSLVKRTMDLAFGAAALLVSAPLMLALAVLVRLSGPGPILYRQRRIGQGDRAFEMLKFRSMRPDAESQSGPVWAGDDDDRCTPIGRILRRYSLDELPQLFNVLAGDMSLVGPRPERGHFIEKFRGRIPNYTQRHQVKAGMTGWAQVNGWRGNTSLRRRVECDLYYIANWSVWLDLKILAMTALFGFRQRNA